MKSKKMSAWLLALCLGYRSSLLAEEGEEGAAAPSRP